MRILMHSCCAPCSIIPLEIINQKKFECSLYFYNPNIHPYKEYKKRLCSLQEYVKVKKLNLYIGGVYGLKEFLRAIVFHEKERCTFCYQMRLDAAAEFAVQNNYSAFTTTLLYSKYQKHEVIRKIAQEASQKWGIQFWYYDFRIGWKSGIEAAKAENLYRQAYCGCIYSEQERYDKLL